MNRDRRLWTIQEDKAISQLVDLYGNKNWAFISFKMQQDYQILNRSGKQCRERWINHLSPDISKDKWSEQQEERVFLNYLRYGNKWKQISSLFPGRTDNCIKNHFYSTLRRSLRRINKFVGIRNSTQKMREIKPSILSKMLDNSVSSQQVGAFKDFAEILFQFSSFKPNKDNIGIMNELISKKYKKNIAQVLYKINELNDNYSKEKQIKPQRKRKQQKSKPSKKKIKLEDPTKQQNSQQEQMEIKNAQGQNQSQISDEDENQNGGQQSEKNIKQQFQQGQFFTHNDSNHQNYKKLHYRLDQKSQKLHCDIDEYDDQSYFKDLQIIGKPIKLIEVEVQQYPAQEGEIFQMLFQK